jgi:predicted regulator of Ras-like GTPase activity (Roadblock/LC7/MglB family)
MIVEKKLQAHFEKIDFELPSKGFTILAISAEGQVLTQLGEAKNNKELQSLGALLAGVWQASEALKDFMDKDVSKDELKLTFQNTDSGYLLLPPTEKNPKIIFAFLFEKQVNPGKIKFLAGKISDHFSEIEILEKNNGEKEEFLFKNITEDEVDKLFSFAGI